MKTTKQPFLTAFIDAKRQINRETDRKDIK
jgi:hypothetical protein